LQFDSYQENNRLFEVSMIGIQIKVRAARYLKKEHNTVELSVCQ